MYLLGFTSPERGYPPSQVSPPYQLLYRLRQAYCKRQNPLEAVSYRRATTGSKKTEHNIGRVYLDFSGVTLFTQLPYLNIPLHLETLRYLPAITVVALILASKKDLTPKILLVNNLSHNNKYGVIPLFQSKIHVLQGIPK